MLPLLPRGLCFSFRRALKTIKYLEDARKEIYLIYFLLTMRRPGKCTLPPRRGGRGRCILQLQPGRLPLYLVHCSLQL